jgi:Calcineurin-like phosphoesterase
VATARLILVSDTHLSASAPQAQANWDAVVGYVRARAPDLVVHLGDLCLDGARDAADLRHGRTQLDRLPVAWRVVPGNHDIGADHWSVSVGGWMVLALNAQPLGSGLEAEAAQWSWLEEQIGGHRGRQPVALITHTPVTATGTELAAAPPNRFWPPPARDRLTRLFGSTPPALVMSGHVHQYRLLRLDRTDHLWVPTTWAVLPDHAQPDPCHR